MRRFTLATVIAFVTGLLGLPGSALAQADYPSRTVKIVVPSAAGSTTDFLARLMADELGKVWGKTVIVENLSGGAMNVGAQHVARSEPDGYTLMVAPPAPIAFNDLLYPTLGYDPRKWVLIAALARIPNVFVIRQDLPSASVQEFIRHAKENPGKATYASQGVGSTAHLSAAQLEMLAGIKMVHVPYRGAQPALTDVVAGRIDLFFDTVATSLPLHQAGKVKILGIGSEKRSDALPRMPTVAEQNLPGFRSTTWFGLVGPPGMPSPVVRKINRDVVDILKKPDVVAKLKQRFLEPIGGTPEEGASFVAAERELWSKVIKESKIAIQ